MLQLYHYIKKYITEWITDDFYDALKFTEAGGVVLSAAADEGTGVRFRVKDTGIGIAEEDREEEMGGGEAVLPTIVEIAASDLPTDRQG